MPIYLIAVKTIPILGPSSRDINQGTVFLLLDFSLATLNHFPPALTALLFQIPLAASSTNMNINSGFPVVE